MRVPSGDFMKFLLYRNTECFLRKLHKQACSILLMQAVIVFWSTHPWAVAIFLLSFGTTLLDRNGNACGIFLDFLAKKLWPGQQRYSSSQIRHVRHSWSHYWFKFYLNSRTQYVLCWRCQFQNYGNRPLQMIQLCYVSIQVLRNIKVNLELKAACDWLHVNRLSLNVDKSEMLSFRAILAKFFL